MRRGGDRWLDLYMWEQFFPARDLPRNTIKTPKFSPSVKEKNYLPKFKY
jgi:hypothetical protein